MESNFLAYLYLLLPQTLYSIPCVFSLTWEGECFIFAVYPLFLGLGLAVYDMILLPGTTNIVRYKIGLHKWTHFKMGIDSGRDVLQKSSV